MYTHTQMLQAAGRSLGLLSSITDWLAGLAGSLNLCGPIRQRLTLQQCISCMQILACRCAVQASNGVRGTVVRLTNNENVAGEGVHKCASVVRLYVNVCAMVAVPRGMARIRDSKTALPPVAGSKSPNEGWPFPGLYHVGFQVLQARWLLVGRG